MMKIGWATVCVALKRRGVVATRSPFLRTTTGMLLGFYTVTDHWTNQLF